MNPLRTQAVPPVVTAEVMAETHIKRYFGKLHERNGEQEYLHHMLFEADAQDDGFYFYCGSLFVAPATLVEVTEEEYEALLLIRHILINPP
ncbi:MAG: hypothetical protein PHI11_00830 [Gallionella sp.]|nr:hypothetical protein [Gallionella sp.]